MSALKYYEDALSLAIKHNDKFDSEQYFIIGSISQVYRDMGYFEKSLTYAERCIDGYRMTKGIRSGYYSLALALKADILQKMEDKDSSMSVRMLSLEILRKIYGFSDICISQGYIPLIRSYIENKLKRSSCWPGGTEGQYEDRVVRQEDISMGINPVLDYLSMPSSVEIKAGAATAN